MKKVKRLWISVGSSFYGVLVLGLFQIHLALAAPHCFSNLGQSGPNWWTAEKIRELQKKENAQSFQDKFKDLPRTAAQNFCEAQSCDGEKCQRVSSCKFVGQDDFYSLYTLADEPIYRPDDPILIKFEATRGFQEICCESGQDQVELDACSFSSESVEMALATLSALQGEVKNIGMNQNAACTDTTESSWFGWAQKKALQVADHTFSAAVCAVKGAIDEGCRQVAATSVKTLIAGKAKFNKEEILTNALIHGALPALAKEYGPQIMPAFESLLSYVRGGKSVDPDKSITAFLREAHDKLSSNKYDYQAEQVNAVLPKIKEMEAAIKRAFSAKNEGHTRYLSDLYKQDKLTLNEVWHFILQSNPSLDQLPPEMAFIRKHLPEIESSMTLPNEAIRLDSSEVKKRCNQEIRRSDELKVPLMTMAEGIVNLSNASKADTERQFHLVVGEPGNGKTTGLNLVASCTGVPLCKISAANINGRDKNLDVLLYLKMQISKCIKDGMVDPNNPGRVVTNGIILLDDIDEVIRAELTGGKDERDTAKLRDQFFQEIKNLASPEQKVFTDPITNQLLNLSRITFYATANSVPNELKPGKDLNQALMSRLTIFNFPYPNEQDRRILLEDKFAELKKSKASILEGQKEACNQKLDEILQYDVNRLKAMRGKHGIRGLSKLSNVFIDYVKSGSKCDTFNVAKEASNLGDYRKTESEGLAFQDISDKASLVKASFDAQKNQILSKPVRDAIKQKLNLVMDNAAPGGELSLRELKKQLEEVEQMIEKNRHTEKLDDEIVKQRYFEKFDYLVSDNISYDSVSSVLYNIADKSDYDDLQYDSRVGKKNAGSGIVSKIKEFLEPPRGVFLVKRDNDYVDMDVVKNLAGVFSAPYCEVSQYVLQRELANLLPEWGKYEIRDYNGPVQAEFLDLDKKRATYHFDFAKRVWSHSTKDRSGNAIVLVYDLTNRRPVPFSQSEYNAPPKSYTELTLDYCFKKWGNLPNQRKGFIFISDPEYSKFNNDVRNELERVLKSGVYETTSGVLMDIKNLNIFIADPGILQADTRAPRSDIPILQLPQLDLEGRKRYARQVLKDGLQTLNAVALKKKIDSLTPEEEKIFELILKADEDIYQKHQGKFPVEWVRWNVEALLLDAIRSRGNDRFGIRQRNPIKFNEEAMRAQLASRYEDYKRRIEEDEKRKNQANDEKKAAVPDIKSG